MSEGDRRANTPPNGHRLRPHLMTGRPSAIALGTAALAAAVSLAVAGCGGSSASSTYVEKSKSAYDDLTASATAISTRLGTATSKDISKVTQAANSQLKLVSRAEGKLRALTVEPAEQQAHKALSSALARQRDFLTVVVKTSKQGQGAANGGITSMRNRADKMIEGYRAFLAVAPEADASITNTGLIKNVGSFATVLRQPVPSSRASRSGGGSAGGSGGFAGFITASGKNACRADGSGIYCSSNTSYAVFMSSSGPWEPVSANPPTALSTSTLGYGTRWTTPDGSISCYVQASGATGVYCRNSSGYGFRLWDGGLVND